MTGDRPAPTVVRLRPPARLPPLGLADLWRSRDVVLMLALRDVKLRYRQTAFGIGWVVLGPLLGAAVFAVVFGGVADLSSEGVPYFVFALAGMTAWNVVASTVLRTTQSLVANAAMVSRVYVPRLALPVSAMAATVVDLVVSCGLLAVACAVEGVAPGPAVLLAPVWLLLLLGLAGGVGLVLAAALVRYRDIAAVVVLGVQLVLFASPVAYSAVAVPARFDVLYSLNPLVGLLEGFRWSVLDTPAPSAGRLAVGIVTAVVAPVLGLLWFAKREPDFADLI